MRCGGWSMSLPRNGSRAAASAEVAAAAPAPAAAAASLPWIHTPRRAEQERASAHLLLPTACCPRSARCRCPQEEAALQPSPLMPLHNHRRVLGVVGVMHCPSVQDIGKAYQQFEQRCK